MAGSDPGHLCASLDRARRGRLVLPLEQRLVAALNVLVFDIETVPDVAGGRRLYAESHGALDDIEDQHVADIMARARFQKTGREFLALPLQRVVAISVTLRRGDRFSVWSLGDREADEKEIVQRFFDGLERYSPQIVSWNGSGFDLPVLHYRALLHGVSAPRYWENGEDDSSFKWNNYLSRFHSRHLDLMDVLAGYQGRATAGLDDVATLLGLPGKAGMHGGDVWPAYQRGEIDAIRNYCETDVLNTWLVFLHFERMRGRISDERLEAEIELTANTLESAKQAHLHEFLAAWRPARAAQ